MPYFIFIIIIIIIVLRNTIQTNIQEFWAEIYCSSIIIIIKKGRQGKAEREWRVRPISLSSSSSQDRLIGPVPAKCSPEACHATEAFHAN